MLIRQFSLSVAADPNVLQLTFPNEQIPQPNLQSKSQQNTKKPYSFCKSLTHLELCRIDRDS